MSTREARRYRFERGLDALKTHVRVISSYDPKQDKIIALQATQKEIERYKFEINVLHKLISHFNVSVRLLSIEDMFILLKELMALQTAAQKSERQEPKRLH